MSWGDEDRDEPLLLPTGLGGPFMPVSIPMPKSLIDWYNKIKKHIPPKDDPWEHVNKEKIT